MHPYMTIILRAVRSDRKLQGYQITAYIDKQDRRVQIIVVNLAEHENWRMCADAVLLSNHKMNVSALINCGFSRVSLRTFNESELLAGQPRLGPELQTVPDASDS